MSLLANKKGLTILSALFLLFACEESTDLPLGISAKQGKISSHVVEFPVEVEHVRVDLMSSISSLNRFTFIGKMNDEKFGTFKATAYSNIGALTFAEVPLDINENTEVDSAFISLSYNGPYYGQDISSTQSIKVYSLSSAILPTLLVGDIPKEYKYFLSDVRDLNAEGTQLIGEVSFDTSFVKNNILRFPISTDFASKIMDKMKEDTSTIINQHLFNEFIGSVAFDPGENNTFINDLNFLSTSSKIEIYYGTANGAKVVPFPFIPYGLESEKPDQFPIYYSIQSDYTGTALEGFEHTEANSTFQSIDNQLYFRSGVGLAPKISFPKLEDFVNSNNLSKVVINSAYLEIDSVRRRLEINSSVNRTSFPAPPEFRFDFVEDMNNQRIPGVNNETNAGGTMRAQTYITSQSDTLYRYRGDVSQEIETFFNLYNGGGHEGSRNYLQGLLYNSPLPQNANTPPSSWNYQSNLFSLIADPRRIKLKIYYTTLEAPNQD